MNKFFTVIILFFYCLAAKSSGIEKDLSHTFLPACSTPTAPTGLKGITIANSKIYLSWTDNSNNETGFSIERSSVSSSSGFSVIGTVAANVTNYTSAGLSTNKHYWYRVQAFCTLNFSIYSNVCGMITLVPSIANISREQIKSGSVNNCINMASAAFYYHQTDITIPTLGRPLKWERFYNSKLVSYDHVMGAGWSHSYDYVVSNIGDSIWKVHYGDGHEIPFIPQGDGTANPTFGGVYETLVKNLNKTYSLSFKNQEIFLFDSNGVLTSITEKNGLTTTLTYAFTQLSTITGPGGRTLNFVYNGSFIASITDPLSRTVSYTYNAGNALTFTNQKSVTTKYSYDALSKITMIIDGRNDTIVRNTYNLSKQLISQKDAYNNTTTLDYGIATADTSTAILPGGATQRFIHDSLYRLLIEYNEQGDSIIYTYDNFNNLTGITDELNRHSTFTYDNAGNILQLNKAGIALTKYTYNSSNDTLTITNPLNVVVKSNFYDINGNLVAQTDALNNQRTWSYNSSGQVTNSMDWNSQPSSYTYNTSGDMLTHTTVMGTTTYSYDAGGRITSITDANGNITNYTYDRGDMITAIRDALSQNSTFVYDNNNNLIEYKDKKNLSTFYTYDKKNRLIALQDALGNTTSMVYDVRDNVFIITDPLGNAISYSYDGKNRLVGSSNSVSIRQYSHDAVGNLTSYTDETFYTTYFGYDALNRLSRVWYLNGDSVKYTYDLAGNKIIVEDANNLITNYTYDNKGQLLTVKDPDGKTSSFTHDANGNVLTETDANGHATTYNYNQINKVLSESNAAGYITNYSYDAKGNMISKTEPNSDVSIYTYDALDRVSKIVYSSGDSTIYTYDPNNNILTMSNNAGSTSFSYNKVNKPVIMTDVFGNRLTYTYNAGGLRTGITYPGNRTVTYTYNSDNKINKITDWMGHNTSVTYDDAGRVSGINYANGTHANFTYDNKGYLKEMNNKLSNNNYINRSVFTYDAGGNKTAELRVEALTTLLSPLNDTYSYLNDNRLKSVGSNTYTNDLNGNRLNQSGLIPVVYSWTYNNTLASVKFGSSNAVSFKYNAAGFPILKTQTGADTRRYLYDMTMGPPQLIEEQDSTGNTKGTYFYGVGLIARVDSANALSYYHFDGEGNTIALSDSTGNITNTYSYEPFGELLKHSGSLEQPFLFNGRQGNTYKGNNLYLVQNRFYDATSGRFLNKLKENGTMENPQKLNNYLFELNNPLQINDLKYVDVNVLKNTFGKLENRLSKNIYPVK